MKYLIRYLCLFCLAGQALASTLGVHTPFKYSFDANVPKVVQRELDLPDYLQEKFLQRVESRKAFAEVLEVYSSKSRQADIYIRLEITRVDLGGGEVQLLNTFGTTRAGIDVVANFFSSEGDLLDTLLIQRRMSVEAKAKEVLQLLMDDIIQDLMRYLKVIEEYPGVRVDDFVRRAKKQMDLRDYEGAVINFTRAAEVEAFEPKYYKWRSQAKNYLGEKAASKEDALRAKAVKKSEGSVAEGSEFKREVLKDLEREAGRVLGSRSFRSTKETVLPQEVGETERRTIARQKLLDMGEQLLEEELITLADFGELHDFLAKWK